MDSHPGGPDTGGNPPRRTHESPGKRTRTDADQEPLAHRPYADNLVRFAIVVHLGANALRRFAQR